MTLEPPIPAFVPVWHALQLADAAASERDDEELLIIISDACDALVQVQRRIRNGEGSMTALAYAQATARARRDIVTAKQIRLISSVNRSALLLCEVMAEIGVIYFAHRARVD